ncbi:MAG: ABC transporter permease [Rectinemataceae bacterium]
MTLFGLAARNVLRNGRRSILNTIAIGVGVALVFICLGWVQGYRTYIFRTIIRYQTGAAQILRKGYEADAARFPLDLTLPDYQALRKRLLERPGITGASGRVDFLARIISPRGSIRLLGQGIDAPAERGVTTLAQKITQGTYLDGAPGLLLGAGIAKKLQVEPGSVVFVSATDRYGVENRIALTLRGVFSFGYGAMDDRLAYIDLASAWDLLSLDDEVTRIVLAGPGTEEVKRAAVSFVRSLGASSDGEATSGEATSTAQTYPPAAAYGWEEFAKATVSGVRTDTDSFYVVAVILFVLIIVGILNSMSMAVHERYRELATLRALGFRRRDAGRLILYEGAVLAGLGIALGFVIAAPVAWWLGVRGVDIAAYIPKDFPIPFGEIYHADYRVWHALFGAALGILSSLAGSILPARRAARLPIAETIGSGV